MAKPLVDIRASRSTNRMEQKNLLHQSGDLVSKSWSKLLLPNSSATVFQESEMPFSPGLCDSLSTS